MIRSKLLKDQIYDYLSTQVQEGKYKSGSKVNELEISNQLKVSRTPVREALTQLASTGAIIKIPRRGFFVKTYNSTEKSDVYVVIACLDKLAATLCIDSLTEEDYLKLQEITEKIDLSIKYRNYEDYVAYQTLFHDYYINKTGNVTLVQTLNALRHNLVPMSYTGNGDKLFELLEHSNSEHKELLDLLRRKDVAGLSKLIGEHWRMIDDDY